MKKRNIFWGIIFLLVAVCILISELGYLPDINVFKLLLAAMLIAVIIQSIPRKDFAGILFPLAFLCIIFDEVLNIDKLTPWPVLGIALFGSIGLSFLFPKKKSSDGTSYQYDSSNFSESTTQEYGSFVQASVTFNSAIKYISSEHFERAELSSSFGSLKVYFDQAKPQSDSISIHTDTSFGTTIFYIPREWNLFINVNTSFGNIEEKGPKAPDPTSPKITITGDVSFGNLEINYI